mmetsp:Transcript_25963/g.47456  ORF Transcript_25963/g.47456 Transcript_25963/m.47456 type:complete len:213 (-) Transcript_25963:996-1634(-)
MRPIRRVVWSTTRQAKNLASACWEYHTKEPSEVEDLAFRTPSSSKRFCRYSSFLCVYGTQSAAGERHTLAKAHTATQVRQGNTGATNMQPIRLCRGSVCMPTTSMISRNNDATAPATSAHPEPLSGPSSEVNPSSTALRWQTIHNTDRRTNLAHHTVTPSKAKVTTSLDISYALCAKPTSRPRRNISTKSGKLSRGCHSRNSLGTSWEPTSK